MLNIRLVKQKTKDLQIYARSVHRLLHAPSAWRATFLTRITAQREERKLERFQMQPLGFSAVSKQSNAGVRFIHGKPSLSNINAAVGRLHS